MCLKEFVEDIEKEFSEKKIFYIVHLLDKILIGEAETPGALNREVLKAYEEQEILEMHLFNEEKEIFFANINGELEKYEPLLHEESDFSVERRYELMHKYYQILEVIEYMDFDENNMAYADRVVLRRLVKGEKDGKEQSK